MDTMSMCELWESTINAVLPQDLDAKIAAAKILAKATNRVVYLVECHPHFGGFAGKFWGYNATLDYTYNAIAVVRPTGHVTKG